MKTDSSLYQCFSIIDSYLESYIVDIHYVYLLIGTIYEASNSGGPTASVLTYKNGGVQSISLNHSTDTNVSELLTAKSRPSPVHSPIHSVYISVSHQLSTT